MQEIRVTADGRPVCTKCGGHDFIFATTPAGWMTGGVYAPKRLICTSCGTAHALRKLGPYSEASPPSHLPVRSSSGGYYEIDPVGVGLALLGAAAMLVGVFLPRLESSTFARIQENTLIQSGDGIWLVFVAVGIVGATYRSWKAGKRSWSVIVLGLIAIGLAYYEGTSSDLTTLYPVGLDSVTGAGAGVKANPAIGIYAVGVGGVLAAIGGWRMWTESTWIEDEPAPAPRFVPPDAPPDPREADGSTTCPDCAETILAAARVCRFCGYRFDQQAAERTTP